MLANVSGYIDNIKLSLLLNRSYGCLFGLGMTGIMRSLAISCCICRQEMPLLLQLGIEYYNITLSQRCSMERLPGIEPRITLT